MTKIRRRAFLKTAALSAAGFSSAPFFISDRVLGQNNTVPANNKITMGVIGTGNQGWNDIRGFLEDERVQIVALCDVNEESPGYWNGSVRGREPARRMVEEFYAQQQSSGRYSGVDTYEDFREVIARDDIDTLLLALPDHWHAIPVIEGARAGKDMYGEKPLSLTIQQGRAMSDAVRKYNRVFQTGSQQRSDWNFRRICELVRNGYIGELQSVRCGLPGGTPDFGTTGDQTEPVPVPDGFNYERWLGPAPEEPYAPARCHVNFRWILDYSGGQVTDWGGHHPDIAQWGMDTEYTGPVEIRNPSANWAEHPLWNTATEFYFECIYENGVQLIISDKERFGVTFEGTEGRVWSTRGRHEVYPESLRSVQLKPEEVRLYRSDNHFRNFIDCVISREEPVAPVEIAHRSITLAHLGNIAMMLNRELQWDPVNEEFVNDTEANRFVSRSLRSPWRL